MLAQRHSLTIENFLLAFWCSDIKFQNCFYNELFAFYLNRNTCWQMSTNRNNSRTTKAYGFWDLKLLWLTCCFSAYLSSSYRTASGTNYWTIRALLYCNDYFVLGEIHACLGVSSDPMFLWISLNSCLLNLQLVQSHQAEIILVKHFIQERNNVTRVLVERRSFNQSCHKNNATLIEWSGFNPHPGLVVASFEKTLYEDCPYLVASNKQQIQ